MYFRLRNVDYEVTSCSVSFGVVPGSQNLRMRVEINAETDCDKIDEELRQVYLYHNNGFEIGGKTLRGLAGKRFTWGMAVNGRGEEAGTMYVLEHEEVTCGTIEILEVTKEAVKIRWTGLANVYWNDEFGRDVPFETEVEAKIPELPKSKVINGMRASVLKMDKDTQLELLNFGDVLAECQRCREMWQNDDRDAWKKFDATLNLRLTHKGRTYDGRARYKGSATQCETVFDDGCPVRATITKTYIDTANGEYDFHVTCGK